MATPAVIVAVLLLVPLLMMACGSSGGGTGTTVDTSKSLSNLSRAEKNALCAWIAKQFGGYDSRGVCADSATGGLQGPTDPSECVADLLPPESCTATVAELQSCVQSEVRSACSPPSASPAPDCVFLTARACGGASDAGPE